MLYWDSNPIKSLLWSFSGFVIFWVRVWVCVCVREDQCYFTHPCEPKWDYVIYWCVAVHEFIYTCIFKIRRDDKHTYTYTHLNFPSMHLNGSIHIQMRPNIRLSFPVCIYCCICITRANIYIYIYISKHAQMGGTTRSKFGWQWTAFMYFGEISDGTSICC